MKKTYQIKINQGKESQTLDIPLAGAKGQAVTVKAVSGARYQLVDTTTNYGPENIRVSRQGKDMKVSFEGSNSTDLVIEDYYKVSPDGYNGLIGEAESGKFYEYIPESASGLASVPMLGDTSPVVGMALGGMEVAPAGAAVGVLAAGLFNPAWLGVGALGAAAAAGGGGGGSGGVDTTAPTGQTGALSPVAGSDSGKLGDNLTNITKPTITGKAEAGSTVEVSFRDPAGKLTGPYKTKANDNGDYSIPVPDDLLDTSENTKGTQYTPVIKVTDAANNSSTKDGTPFVVDTKAVPVLSLTINADSNNDQLISTSEKGTGKTSVTAELDKMKVVAGDVITFSDGITSQTVTLKDTDITNGQVTTSDWKIPGEGVVLTITAVLMDLAGNVSSVVKDMVTTVIDSLKTALTIDPITRDNIIDATEAGANELDVTGQVTGSFAEKDIVTLELNGHKYTAQVNAQGKYSTKVSMADVKADADTVLEAKVTGTNGNTATAAQSYVIETTGTTGTTTGLFIDPITTDNILNFQETDKVPSLNITGKVTGKFIAGDQVNLKINDMTYIGNVAEHGVFSSVVKINDLLADADTIINATVTGAGGTSAKALQDYGIDTIAATNLALSIDLDKVRANSSYGNDGFINSTEKDNATTTGLTASFDSSSVSIGDVVTFSFSDGSSTQRVVLDQDMVTKGTVTVSGTGKEWALPQDNQPLNVKVTISDAAGNSSTATDSAKVDVTKMNFKPAFLDGVQGTVFTKATFAHDPLEKGNYKMHVGTEIFEGLLDVGAGFKNTLPSSLTGVNGNAIYLEVWDVAGNYTRAGLDLAQQNTNWNLAQGTQFIV